MAAIVGRLPARAGVVPAGHRHAAHLLLWPTKRRWSNANFGHVLGLPPDDPAVRKLALAAYRNYARYLVELMRLPRMPLETVATRVESKGLETLLETWRESGSLILVAAHVGNNEFIAAGAVSHGLPIHVLADDSTFPEMFEHLSGQRRRYGVTVIPWRNLREIYAVLKRGEMLALLVDWGYRPTTSPSGFRRLDHAPGRAGHPRRQTGAGIVPIVSHRRPDGTFRRPMTRRSG